MVFVVSFEHFMTFRRTVNNDQGRRNYFEVGGGGQTSPEVQGNPYPKLKTPRIWPTILGETQVHMEKKPKK